MTIFTYWTGDRTTLRPFVEDWKNFGKPARVFGDAEARSAVNSLLPGGKGLFEMIRLPACRSDVARLALLYQFGGIYVDAHGAPGEKAALNDLLRSLDTYEMIVFDREAEHRTADDVHIINGLVAARPQSPLVKAIFDRVMRNLKAHLVAEMSTPHHVPYNLAVLSGSWAFAETLFDVSRSPLALCYRLSSSVFVKKLPIDEGKAGVILYKHYQYRDRGMHWSERQQKEGLFIEPPLAGSGNANQSRRG